MEGILGKEVGGNGRENGERLELDEKMKRRSHFGGCVSLPSH
jgi:hypothetical protein